MLHFALTALSTLNMSKYLILYFRLPDRETLIEEKHKTQGCFIILMYITQTGMWCFSTRHFLDLSEEIAVSVC